MKKSFMPYILPLITLIAVLVIASINPSITGLAVEDQKDQVTAKVRIFTDANVVIPTNSVVKVILDMKESSMSFHDFIGKSGMTAEIEQGTFPELDYKGEGYTGNNQYIVDLKEFGLGEVERQRTHLLTIQLIYNNKIFYESSQEIK